MVFAEEVTGIPQERLIQFAHEVAKADSVAICWAMGITQQDIGSDSSTAISNLLLITGNYRKPGAGAYPLRGHNNVQDVVTWEVCQINFLGTNLSVMIKYVLNLKKSME